MSSTFLSTGSIIPIARTIPSITRGLAGLLLLLRPARR
jgi:hypothetical protein